MEGITDPEIVAELRTYCIDTIREAYSGGVRFAVNLTHYLAAQSESERETIQLLIELYGTLVRNNELRVETARSWLLQHHPDDVAKYFERVVPHSPLWFSIVDRAEPQLDAVARLSIQKEQSPEVCSSCDDPARELQTCECRKSDAGSPILAALFGLRCYPPPVR